MQPQIRQRALGSSLDFGNVPVPSVPSSFCANDSACRIGKYKSIARQLTNGASKPSFFSTMQRRRSEKCFSIRPIPANCRNLPSTDTISAVPSDMGTTMPSMLVPKRQVKHQRQKTLAETMISVVDMQSPSPDWTLSEPLSPAKTVAGRSLVQSPARELGSLSEDVTDSPKGMSRVLAKYRAQITAGYSSLAGDPRALGKLFAEVFRDLGECVPENRRLFEEMGALAESLTGPGAMEMVGDKAVAATAQMGTKKDIKIHKCKIARGQAGLSVVDFSKFNSVATRTVNSETETTFASLTKPADPQTCGIRKRRVVRVPRLDVARLSSTAMDDYNQEFYSKMDEFSDSWREDAKCTRTLGK